MAIEIEVKAKVLDKKALMQKVSALGCTFSNPTSQDDTVYVKNTGSLETFLSNDAFLRIRIQGDGKTILTAKKPKNKSAENLIKREHEVTVNSAEEARCILELMGYQEAVRVRKTRRIAEYGDYEICLDDIEGLGSFVEVEAMGRESDAEKTQKDLWEFLKKLDISPVEKISKGYDILMLEKSSS